MSSGTPVVTIDPIVGGIYRISSWADEFGITFNQFLIDDERPTLIHTGTYGMYEGVRTAISEVLDPARLEHIVLLHWEGDENGGMDRFMAEATSAELVGSAMSIGLNAVGFGVQHRVRGVTDGETLDLGRHRLRFLETPHVHHWDSMMVFDELTRSVFPSDLYLQPGPQPAVVDQDLGAEMCVAYREVGIFAHEQPVRDVADRIEALSPQWMHAMHGGTLTREAIPYYTRALREQEFGYCNRLMGRDLPATAVSRAAATGS
jgi:flavorubredoxin